MPLQAKEELRILAKTGAMMRKRIYLHAGAHRTGSSSFQMGLYENRGVLGAAGYDLAYPSRDGVPEGGLNLRLPAPRHNGQPMGKFIATVENAVARFSPDPARDLILSEENIPGRMFHFYQGQFFPAARQRFDAFRAGIGDADVQILYVLRPYDALFVSAYRKRAEDNAVPPFETLVPNFLAMDRGWPELLDEFRDVLRPSRLSVVPFANRGSSRSLIARLVPGVSEQDLQEPETVLNLSATDAALRVLQDRYRAGEVLERASWQEIVRSHAQDRTSDGFAEFDPDQRAILRARYKDDLARIAEMGVMQLD